MIRKNGTTYTHAIDFELEAQGCTWIENADDWYGLNEGRFVRFADGTDEEEDALMRVAWGFLQGVYLRHDVAGRTCRDLDDALKAFTASLDAVAAIQAYNRFIREWEIDDKLAQVAGRVVVWDESEEPADGDGMVVEFSVAPAATVIGQPHATGSGAEGWGDTSFPSLAEALKVADDRYVADQTRIYQQELNEQAATIVRDRA